MTAIPHEGAGEINDAPKPEDFKQLKIIGKGAYGTVLLVKQVLPSGCTKKMYAMKVIQKAGIMLQQKMVEYTRTERKILEAVRPFPFLVTLHYAYQTENTLNLILDYACGGELFRHLHMRGHFDDHEVRLYIAEIIIAVEHLHKLKIIYRDLKLENILLNAEGHIVLTDFGLSKILRTRNDRANTFCGTIEYLAPEIVSRDSRGHGIAVDWWSVGVVTYELRSGSSPFTIEGESNYANEIIQRIEHCSYPMLPNGCPEVQDFIKKLLVKDQRKRLGGGEEDATELKRHSFFRNLDWEAVARREVPVPFVPWLTNAYDTCNFADEFTSMPLVALDTQTSIQHVNHFNGYSYVAPSELLSNNEKSGEIGRNVMNNQMEGCFAKNSLFFQKYSVVKNQPLLGEGSYAVCKKCIHKQTEKEYAVKIIQSENKNIKQEIEMLKACQGCPYIIALQEVFQDVAFTYIVLELANGGELMRGSCTFSEGAARRLLAQLAHAVAHMHALGIVHRDLKPANILLTTHRNEDRVKVIDFGFSRRVPECNDRQRMMTPCFSLPYAAPEVVNCVSKRTSAGYGSQCDLWSLGTIFYRMLCGHAPFGVYSKTEPITDYIDKIKAGLFTMEGYPWDNISEDSKAIISSLLAVDEDKRMTVRELLDALSDNDKYAKNTYKSDEHMLVESESLDSINDDKVQEHMLVESESLDSINDDKVCSKNSLELLAAKKRKTTKRLNSKKIKSTRKRKFEDINKPVLREKRQTCRISAKRVDQKMKIVRAKRNTKTVKVNVTNILREGLGAPRMTRSLRHRLESILSVSQLNYLFPLLSLDSEVRLKSTESGKHCTVQ